MFGAWLRNKVFWTLDTLKGGKIKEHRKDILAKLSGERSIDTALSEILFYAQNNVPFYQGKKYEKLTDFPVVDKMCIMDNYDQFRSIEYRDDSQLHEVSTSGSSGNPFHAFQNKDKRNRVIAELAAIHEILGWNIGDRYVFLRAWTGNYNGKTLQRIKQNFIPIEVTGFDSAAMDRVRNTLKKDHKIRIIIGYSSSLMELAEYMIENGDTSEQFSVQLVIADSDALLPSGKQKLETVFGCPVISRYDNEEQGILAYTSPYEDTYIINSASYYVEILAMDSDEPAAPGETGRIVVTDMYNKAMAFIRYDTGDLAIAGECDANRCLTLRALQGRTSDVVYALDGTAIYSPSVNNYICDFFDIKKYQLIQKSKGTFELLLVCCANQVPIEQVDANMRKLLGQNVDLTIRVVDEIPVGKNGKFKTVVNQVN